MRSGEPELGSCSCCCLACSSTNLHEEVWSPGRIWRNVLQLSQWEGGQNCSAPVECKPVRKRCEDVGGNSRTICQGELREQFLSSRLSAARQALEGAQLAPGTLATLAALTNPMEDLQHLANLWEEGSRNTSLSNVSSWTRNFFSSTSGQRGGVQQLVRQA